MLTSPGLRATEKPAPAVFPCVSEGRVERTGCPIHEVWGMTELAGAASANPVVGPNKSGTIGIAYPGNTMRVVDIDDPNVVLGPGERGELMFRGPMVMDGYYGNDDATRASI